MVTSQTSKEKVGTQVKENVNFYYPASQRKLQRLKKCHDEPSPICKCEILTPQKSAARQFPLQEHYSLSHFSISEAVPALSSNMGSPTNAAVAEAGKCDHSCGQCIALQPKSLALGRAELITPC